VASYSDENKCKLKIFRSNEDELSVQWRILLNKVLLPNWYNSPTGIKSRDSSVGIATDYGLDDRMIGDRIPAGLGIFLFDTVSRPSQGPSSLLFNGYRELFPWG
jgi:hypothetical protein